MIVPGETFDHPQRGVFDRRQPRADFGSYPRFDAGDQVTQDIVEHLDLVLGQALPVLQEQIRELPQGADAPLRGAASDGLFEFGDDGIGMLHDVSVL